MSLKVTRFIYSILFLFVLITFVSSCQNNNSDSNKKERISDGGIFSNFDETNLGMWKDYVNKIPKEFDDVALPCPTDFPLLVSEYQKSIFEIVDIMFIEAPNSPLMPDTLTTIDSILTLIAKDNSRGYPYLGAKILLLKAYHYANVREFKTSIEAVDEGMKILLEQDVLERCDSVLLADSYNLAGICRQSMMDQDISLSLFFSAISINKKLGRHKEVGKDMSNIALSHYIKGAADSSIYYNDITQFFWKKLLKTKQDTFDLLGAKTNRALALRLRSEKFLTQSNKIQFEQSVESTIFELKQVERILSMNYPLNYETLGYYYLTYQNLGGVYQFAKHYPASEDSMIYYFNKAEYVLKKTINQIPPHLAGMILPHKAVAYASKGNCDSAIVMVQHGIDGLILSDNPLIVSADFTYVQALINKGIVLSCCYEANSSQDSLLYGSFDAYSQAIDYLMIMREGFVTEVSQEGLMQVFSNVFSSAFEVAWEISEKSYGNKNFDIAKEYLKKAFLLAERSKAFTLQQGIYTNLSQIEFSGDKKKLLEKELFFKETLRKLTVTNPQRLVILQEYREFINELSNTKNVNSFSYFLERFDNSIPSIADLQRIILDDSTALVEYQLGVDLGLSFIITRDTFFAIPFQTDSLLYYHLFQYKQSLAEPKEYYQKSASFLYQRLFEPIASELPVQINKLIIVPDKEISGIPFGALLASSNIQSYLINDFAITYYYSLNSLFKIKELDILRKTDKKLDTWGAFISSPVPTVGIKRSYACSETSIGHVKSMTMDIYDGLKTSSYEGIKIFPEATANDFMANAGKFRLLQLSLHACMAENGDPDQSFLQFAISDSGKNEITVTDIYNLSFNADNVVLSNCNTAIGPNIKGEGLKSFARAFLLSGCSSIIATTSNVSDASTSKIIKYYYENLLEKHQEKHSALQNAKKRYIKEFPNVHPWEWANIICIGEVKNLSFIDI